MTDQSQMFLPLTWKNTGRSTCSQGSEDLLGAQESPDFQTDMILSQAVFHAKTFQLPEPGKAREKPAVQNERPDVGR